MPMHVKFTWRVALWKTVETKTDIDEEKVDESCSEIVRQILAADAIHRDFFDNSGFLLTPFSKIQIRGSLPRQCSRSKGKFYAEVQAGSDSDCGSRVNMTGAPGSPELGRLTTTDHDTAFLASSS